MHLVHLRVVRGLLAVVGQTHAEDDGVDAVKQVEPLPTLRPLAPDVMDTEYHVLVIFRKKMTLRILNEPKNAYCQDRHIYFWN